MKAPTIALAVSFKDGSPRLVDTISDSREILILEEALELGADDALQVVYDHREKQSREDNEFSDYVENLLSKPFLKDDVQKHGIQWLKSRMRIDQFQKDEAEAAKVIANYAFEIFSEDQQLKDFFLAGPKAQVRVRVFVIPSDMKRLQSA